MGLMPGAATQRDLFIQWPPVVTFDFANATPEQKEVFARENKHAAKYFPSPPTQESTLARVARVRAATEGESGPQKTQGCTGALVHSEYVYCPVHD